MFVDEGYYNFSLRKVAFKAGVSIGNLQHHFPTKEILLSVMLDHIVSGYLEDFENLMMATESPADQLCGIVRSVVEDSRNRETVMFFPELWSLANHDPNARKLMDKMYSKYMAVYSHVIRQINADLSDDQIKKASVFIAASLEGLGLFIGHGKNESHRADAMIEVACTSFLHILQSGCIPE